MGTAMGTSLTADDVAAHVARIGEQRYTIVADAIEADLLDELGAELERLERELDVKPAGNPFEGSATVCNTMWALTDFTEGNGATRLVPGSHLAEASPEIGRHYDSIAAEMPRDSVLIWHGSLWHGGGANTTDERRVGIAMNYCAGYIRQQENQQLDIPREIAAGFEERLQRLCGYSVYAGLIGHIDKRDPIELLPGEWEHSMVWDG